MSAERRSELALRRSDDLRRIAAEGIRTRHPGYSESEVRRALAGVFYGVEAAAKVWPGLSVPPP
jgi:hypothetical protein